MRHDEIRDILQEEARSLVPNPPDLWPRVSAALARSRNHRRAGIRRWLGGLAAFLLAAAAAAAALLQVEGSPAQDRSLVAVPVPSLSAAAEVRVPAATPLPTLAMPADDRPTTVPSASTPLPFWSLTPAPIALPASGLGIPAASLPSPAAARR